MLLGLLLAYTQSIFIRTLYLSGSTYVRTYLPYTRRERCQSQVRWAPARACQCTQENAFDSSRMRVLLSSSTIPAAEVPSCVSCRMRSLAYIDRRGRGPIELDSSPYSLSASGNSFPFKLLHNSCCCVIKPLPKSGRPTKLTPPVLQSIENSMTMDDETTGKELAITLE